MTRLPPPPTRRPRAAARRTCGGSGTCPATAGEPTTQSSSRRFRPVPLLTDGDRPVGLPPPLAGLGLYELDVMGLVPVAPIPARAVQRAERLLWTPAGEPQRRWLSEASRRYRDLTPGLWRYRTAEGCGSVADSSRRSRADRQISATPRWDLCLWAEFDIR